MFLRDRDPSFKNMFYCPVLSPGFDPNGFHQRAFAVVIRVWKRSNNFTENELISPFEPLESLRLSYQAQQVLP